MTPSFARTLRAYVRYVLPALFLLLLPTCVFVALSMPTGEQPDEVAHAVRADSLLHRQLLGRREPRPDGRTPFWAGVTANPALLDGGFTFYGEPLAERKVTPRILDRLAGVPWADKLAFVEASNTAVYFPAFYLPCAFGIGMAHVMGFGPQAAIIGGRLANVAAYAVLGLAALLLAERANLAIFVALALPMSLSLAGSACPDPVLIGVAALSAAALTRTGPERRWARPLAGLGLAALIATKLPYFPLAICAFAPMPLRGWTWRQVRRAATEAAAVALPGFAWAAVAVAFVSVPFVRGPAYLPGELWPGDPQTVFQTTDMGAQAQVLLHQPSLLVTLPVDTLTDVWDNYVRSMIGILGLVDIDLPDWSYVLWSWALGAAAAAECMRPRGEPRSVRGGGALLVFAAIVASVFAILLAQYLSWTRVGQTLVDGVQGRYFLPLIPFLGLAIPPLGARRLDPVRWLASVPAAVAALSGIGMLPQLIVTTFYVH